MVIFIKSPKPVKATFGISFTSPRYLAKKNDVTSDPFGDTHRQFLFGTDAIANPGKANRQVRQRTKSRGRADGSEDAIKKNKEISAIYGEYKEKFQ